MALSASVIVCTASPTRIALLRNCVESLLAGTRAPSELLVVVDSNPLLRTELTALLPRSVRLLQTEQQGLSVARNVGIHAASGDVVAFVDDDAAVEREWLSSVMEAFDHDDDLLGVGGSVVPRWGADPRWLTDELLWVVGCTYRGHREDAGPIRNPIGCNMAFRRLELIAAGCFAIQFGKRGNALDTCEETELSLRLERVYGPGRIRYVPAARVQHFVPAARISWRLLVRRSISEGLAKGRLHRLYRRPALGPERSYVRRLVADAAPRLLIDGVRRRDGRRLQAAGAIVLSLLIAGLAFLAAAVAPRRRHTGRSRFRSLVARAGLLALVVGSSAAVADGPAPRDRTPAGQRRGWHRVFADDFTRGLSASRWGRYSGQPGGDPGGLWAPSHAVVKNGILNLETYRDPRFGGRWVSGGVSSAPGLKQTYGRYEVRFRMDAGKGVSAVLLLWPTKGAWPPEIDFAEDGGVTTARNRMSATLHYGADNSQIQRTVRGDFARWHTMGVEWTPGRLVYTLDGRRWAAVRHREVPDEPMEMDLQTQAGTCGDRYAPCPDSTTPPRVTLEVAWVVAYAYSHAAEADR